MNVQVHSTGSSEFSKSKWMPYEVLQNNFDHLLNVMTPVLAEVAGKTLAKKLISLNDLSHAEDIPLILIHLYPSLKVFQCLKFMIRII